MTTPHTSSATQLKIRWDNIAIVAVAIAVIGAGVPLLMHMSAPPAPAAHASTPAPTSTPKPEATGPTFTLEQANERVAQARQLMLAGEFEKAQELVIDIGGAISDQSGASILRNEIATRQANFAQFMDDARTAHDAGKWSDALRAIAGAEKLAPLPEDLQRIDRHSRSMQLQDQTARRINALVHDGKLNDAREQAHHALMQFNNERFTKLLAMVEHKIKAREARLAAQQAAEQEAAMAMETPASPAAPAAGNGGGGQSGGGSQSNGTHDPSHHSGGATTASANSGLDVTALMNMAGGAGGGSMGGMSM